MVASMRAMPNYNVMGVANAALEASVRHLAADFGPPGILLNAISRGRCARWPVPSSATRARCSLFSRNISRWDVALTRMNSAFGAFIFADLSGGVTGESTMSIPATISSQHAAGKSGPE